MTDYIDQIADETAKRLCADPDEHNRFKAEIAGVIIKERERCAKLVPTTWLDPLLTGKDAARPPLGERAIEALLRGIQDRIRADT